VKGLLRRLGAIAWNTFREAIRNKILYALLFFGIAVIGAALALGQLMLGEEGRLIRDLGLGGISLFGVLIAVFVGVSLLYKELDLRTIYVIVPKPLRRSEFVLGKFLGMALTVTVLVAIMMAVLSAVELASGTGPDLALVKAVILLWVEILVVTAVALVFSSFSTPYLSGMLTLGLFAICRTLPEVEQLARKASPAVRSGVKAMLAVLPNLHLFFVSGHAVEGKVVTVHGAYVSWAYVGYTSAYGLGYVLVMLTLAAVIFARRDFM
jgi:ABC-type transport system involved in multi-copper enzyme maturation permease subunit